MSFKKSLLFFHLLSVGFETDAVISSCLYATNDFFQNNVSLSHCFVFFSLLFFQFSVLFVIIVISLIISVHTK